MYFGIISDFALKLLYVLMTKKAMIPLIILLAVTQGVNAGVEQCPPKLSRTRYLRQLGTSCYEFVFNHAGDWNHAHRDCQSRNGSLITINSQKEQNFIYNSLNVLRFHNDRGIWIGLNDREKEGHWHWDSGEPVTYKHWASGQPGLFGSFEDCALLEFKNGGHWHDYSCEGILFNKQHHGWVCEYGIIQTFTPFVTSGTTPGPTVTMTTTRPPTTTTTSAQQTTTTTAQQTSTTFEQTTTTTMPTTASTAPAFETRRTRGTTASTAPAFETRRTRGTTAHRLISHLTVTEVQ